MSWWRATSRQVVVASFGLTSSLPQFCGMKSLQDLTWGVEKNEQLVFALDIGTTSSELFSKLAPV
jgi:hypothetical protein